MMTKRNENDLVATLLDKADLIKEKKLSKINHNERLINIKPSSTITEITDTCQLNPQDCNDNCEAECNGLYWGDCKDNCEAKCDGLYWGDCKDNNIEDRFSGTDDSESCHNLYDEECWCNRIHRDRRVRHDSMFLDKFGIDFERVDYPTMDEVTSASIYYDYEAGKQVLSLTVEPLGHDTYLDKLLSESYCGRIYLVNKNVDIKLSKQNTILTTNGIIRSVNCQELVRPNTKNIDDIVSTLSYEVEIEL